MDLVTLTNAYLRATIDPVGAQLSVLADAQGRDLLWSGDPAFWTGRAPILFPVIGCLADGTYHLRDKSHALPKHGFARHSAFMAEPLGPERAAFSLGADAGTMEAYPFDFALKITFALEGASLVVTAAIANRGRAPMPASFGFHPAFNWPLPDGGERDDHIVTFAQDEPAPVRRIDADGLLLPDSRPSPIEGRILRPRDALFEADALIFDRIISRRVEFGVPGQRRLAVEFDDFDILGIWTKPGAPFLCIEPWHGLPDPVGFAGDIFDKPAIMAIAPGETRELTMRITILDQDASPAADSGSATVRNTQPC